MMTEKIMGLCRSLGAGEDQEELLLPLVQAAEQSLAARLRRGVEPADCGSAFPLAAAMVAMEGLERASGMAGVTSFSAGEVSIRTGGGSADRIAQAERLLAPWLGETGFAFRGVRG